MNPVKFAEQNTTWAEDQTNDYQPLPAYSNEEQTVSCWRLTLRERIKLLFTGRLWLQQMNFGEPLQPQYLTTEKPFERQRRSREHD